MIKRMSILSSALLAISVAANTNAATVVVDWNFTGLAGTETSLAANSAAANVTGSAMAEGAGLIGNSGLHSMNARGWSNEVTDYFSFGFSIDSGYEADLSSLSLGTRSSGSGPGTLGLFYSGDGFTNSLYTFNQSGGSNFVYSIVDLSSLQDLTGAIEFRISQIGTVSAGGGVTGSTGTFRVANYYDGANNTNFAITGDISPVPVPAAIWLLGSGLIGLAGVARKRKAS